MELNAGSIPALVAQQVAAHGADTILRKKDRGIWKAVTWAEVDARVREIGQALLAMNFGEGDVAAILADTRPEFVYADLAVLGAGGASVAIHPEEEAGRVGHILHSAGARVVFVEDEEQLDKVLTIRAHCPALARVVILEPKGLREFSDLQCSFLRDFVAGGAGRTGWAEAVAAVRPESQAAVLYPRGEPNAMGRMLTHGDILHMLAQAQRMLGLRPGDERLAVLPMNDVTERVLGLYLALATGTISNYLEGPETATENLQQLQPTVFAADAAVWDALHARTTRAAAAATPLQRTLYNWAIRIGQARSVLRPLADLLVLRAVRRELGLTKLRLAYVGGRPVSAEVDVWSRALGIVLQRVDRPETGAATADDRYRTLIQGAYAGA